LIVGSCERIYTLQAGFETDNYLQGDGHTALQILMSKLPALFIVLIIAALPFVQGGEYTVEGSRFHREGVLSGKEADAYLLTLKAGDRANWTAVNINNTRMDFILLERKELAKALAGSEFEYDRVRSALNTSLGCNRGCDDAGDFAILVRPSGSANASAPYAIFIRIVRAPVREPAALTGWTVLAAFVAAISVPPLVWLIHVFKLFHDIRAPRAPFAAPPPKCPSCGGGIV